MEESGFTLEKIRQGVFTLSEPMKQLEADLKNKVVIYDNNPVLKWCLANTQAKVDINGNIQPCKLNSKFKRIDGAVALIIAYAVLNKYVKEYENMQSSEVARWDYLLEKRNLKRRCLVSNLYTTLRFLSVVLGNYIQNVLILQIQIKC